MGELYNNDMINDNIIYDYLDFFINNLELLIKTNSEHIESNIISIYVLLKTCNNINNKKKIQDKINNMEKSTLPKRLQFKLLDIVEL